MRIFSVRLIAVAFLCQGLWNLFLFFEAMSQGVRANVVHLLIGIILFRTGYNLFSLREIGRKLAIIIFGLNILQILFVGSFIIFQNDFGIILGGPGFSYESDSALLTITVFSCFIAINVLLGLLLLQKNTRLIFQSR